MEQLDIFTKRKRKIPFPPTYEEMEKIESLERKNFTAKEIAGIINRSATFVQNAFTRCGGRRFYTAKKDKDEYEKRRKTRIENLKNYSKSLASSQKQLIDRIECIEMQVEIILDTIKKLQKV